MLTTQIIYENIMKLVNEMRENAKVGPYLYLNIVLPITTIDILT